MGDRKEPALTDQTAVCINANNAEESKESCIKIFIFLNLLDRKFLKENGLRFRQTLNRNGKQNSMSFLNELIERSGAVSNACQSWHVWGMSLDFVVNWLKKRQWIQKYRPIVGYGYFIRKGVVYSERRRESRDRAISSIFFSRSYLQKFFFRDNWTRIFIAFYHSPSFIRLESSTLVPLATLSCCIIF